jgi:hypothetical protein
MLISTEAYTTKRVSRLIVTRRPSETLGTLIGVVAGVNFPNIQDAV